MLKVCSKHAFHWTNAHIFVSFIKTSLLHLSSEKYLGVVHETPIPRLTEIAFNKFPGSEEECQRKAASITGGAKLHKVLI